MLISRAPAAAATIAALMERELRTTFGASPISVLWAVLESVLAILILTALFYTLVAAPPLGDSFALFYASGVIPLMVVQTTVQKAAVALRAARPMLIFGRVGLFEIALAQICTAFGIQTLAGAVVLLLVCAFTSWSLVGGFGPVFLALSVFALGFGLFSFWLGALFTAWPRVLAMALRPLILISGVFFLIDDIGQPYASWLLANPIAQLIMAFRTGVYGFYAAHEASILFPLIVGFMLGAIGALCLRLSAASILDRNAP